MRRIALLLGAALLALTSMTSVTFADAGDWLIRLRGVAVNPVESADITVIGGDLDVDNNFVPELDFTYFFTDNVAAELILATTKHDLVATDTTLGDVPLGDVRLLPPTLLLQYHPIPDGAVSPYVGAGINLTLMFNEDAAGGAVTDLKVDNAFGFALQAGADIKINDDWFINVDVKKVFLKTDASINLGAIEAKVKLNPWIFGFGFGRRL